VTLTFPVLLPPGTERLNHRDQGAAVVAEAVADLGRPGRSHLPQHQPITLQVAQALGQQLVADLRDQAPQIAITLGALPAAGVYAASKAAVEQFGMALAKELGPRGITVNQIGPGVTDTDGLIMPAEALAHLVASTPLGRLGQPADLADVVAFLASDDARWVNGQTLQVNGGIL
jgi:NAD(P)-dependent dehydrogenase (short-subunit alcohol dehydrogenase family)